MAHHGQLADARASLSGSLLFLSYCKSEAGTWKPAVSGKVRREWSCLLRAGL